jgi:hypothetical protein
LVGEVERVSAAGMARGWRLEAGAAGMKKGSKGNRGARV